MTTKKIVLCLFVFTLIASPVIAYQYWEEFLQMLGVQMPEVVTSEPVPAVIQADVLVDIHTERVQERIDLLKNQTLEESFDELLESQQYFYPGGKRSDRIDPQEMETLLSTRTFLKVFQQFGELPREQALEKLPWFCESVIETFGDALDEALPRSGIRPPLGTPMKSLREIKFKVCTSMLLAARLGENELLFNQIDMMQSLIDEYIARAMDCGTDISINVRVSALLNLLSLDDDCILTVLMYALKQKDALGEIEIPDTIKQYTYPLYRWDSEATFFDFLVDRGMQELDINDSVENFTVYALPEKYFPKWRLDDQQKNIILDDHERRVFLDYLKERLLK